MLNIRGAQLLRIALSLAAIAVLTTIGVAVIPATAQQTLTIPTVAEVEYLAAPTAPTVAPTATPTPTHSPTPTPEPTPTPRAYKGITEGDVIQGVATHYCVCYTCCGKTDGITKSEFVIWNGMEDPHIVACNWLPFGSVVRINGIEYTVRDRGGDFGKVGRVDIFEPKGHLAARKRGKPDVEIEIVMIGEG